MVQLIPSIANYFVPKNKENFYIEALISTTSQVNVLKHMHGVWFWTNDLRANLVSPHLHINYDRVLLT